MRPPARTCPPKCQAWSMEDARIPNPSFAHAPALPLTRVCLPRCCSLKTPASRTHALPANTPSLTHLPPQVLSLEEASLCGWATVLLLRRLPRLAKLYLSGNPLITTVTYPASPPAQTAAAPQGAQGSGPQAPEQQQQGQDQQQGAPHGAAGAAGAGAGAAGAGAVAEEAGAAGAAAAGAGAEAAAPFACLQGLYLGSCGISDWASVNELDRFPALRVCGLMDEGPRMPGCLHDAAQPCPALPAVDPHRPALCGNGLHKFGVLAVRCT